MDGAGKVRYIGTTTFGAWQIVESLWVAKELGLNRFVSEQPPYNILDRRIERELVPMMQTYGIANIPWSPLAMGLLTGKYKREEEAPDNSRFADIGDNQIWQRRFATDFYDVTEGLESMVEEKGCTMAQLALAWCVQQPGVTSPIIGPRTMAQLEDNLGALDVTVTDDDRAKIDELSPPGRMITPFYEADFGPHQYR
jgi:aryl-alcohol dehydrogenase-like predicted oxidoreductase